MTYDGPVYVSDFLGAGGDWLCMLDPSLVPLTAWMGGKRKLAPDILKILDIRPGHPIPSIVGDLSWWGWVWPTVLDPQLGPEVSAMLRFWKARGDDPRALWFALREQGPNTHPVEAAAQLLWLQARAASGVPVWWEGTEAVQDRGWKGVTATRTLFPATQMHAKDPGLVQRARADGPAYAASMTGHNAELVSMDGHGRGPYRAWQMTGKPALLQHAGSKVDEAGQTRATEPKLLASDGRGDPREAGARTTRSERLIATTRGNGQGPGAPYDAGHKGTDDRGGGGIVDMRTIANRADRIRARARDFQIFHVDALALVEEFAPRLGKRARFYHDFPYDGATGYPAQCPREKALVIADKSASHGGRVVVSEAVGLAKELGRGWTQAQLQGGKKPEWVTCYGCDVGVLVPPLLAMMRAGAS